MVGPIDLDLGLSELRKAAYRLLRVSNFGLDFEAPNSLGPQTRKVRRRELLCVLRRAREELGRWPTAGEWEFATSLHVSRRAYVSQFGTWRRACRTAARLKLL